MGKRRHRLDVGQVGRRERESWRPRCVSEGPWAWRRTGTWGWDTTWSETPRGPDMALQSRGVRAFAHVPSMARPTL